MDLRSSVNLKGLTGTVLMVVAIVTWSILKIRETKRIERLGKKTYLSHECAIYQSSFVKDEPSVPVRVVIAKEVANGVVFHCKEGMQHLHS
jgi:hypothetical protein